MNDHYVYWMPDDGPPAFPNYPYNSREEGQAACESKGLTLCPVSAITGFEQCAVGWLSDGQGFFLTEPQPGKLLFASFENMQYLIFLNVICAFQAVVEVATWMLLVFQMVERIAVQGHSTYRMMLLLAAVTLTSMVPEKQPERHVRAGDWDYAAKSKSPAFRCVRMGG